MKFDAWWLRTDALGLAQSTDNLLLSLIWIYYFKIFDFYNTDGREICAFRHMNSCLSMCYDDIFITNYFLRY